MEVRDVHVRALDAAQLRRAFSHAVREEGFLSVAATALVLILIGTLVYTLGEGWDVVDAFYFAVATLTTSSIADPSLVLTDPWLKIFTAFYVLIGIGILVEVIRRLGFGFVTVLHKDRLKAQAAHEKIHERLHTRPDADGPQDPGGMEG
ncbi:MAG: potassium channel family protein [Nocardioides sp.]